jgi:hypothetical protein
LMCIKRHSMRKLFFIPTYTIKFEERKGKRASWDYPACLAIRGF